MGSPAEPSRALLTPAARSAWAEWPKSAPARPVPSAMPSLWLPVMKPTPAPSTAV